MMRCIVKGKKKKEMSLDAFWTQLHKQMKDERHEDSPKKLNHNLYNEKRILPVDDCYDN